MKRRIARFNIHQTSKAIALMYVIFGLLFVPKGAVLYLSNSDDGKGLATLYLLTPLWIALFGYIAIALSCWVNSLIAEKFGGIEYEVSEIQPSSVRFNRTEPTVTKIKSADPADIICSNCHTKQWIGRTDCQSCGARFLSLRSCYAKNIDQPGEFMQTIKRSLEKKS